jgi:hypothetical protein
VNITYRLNYGRNELKALAAELQEIADGEPDGNLLAEFPKLHELFQYITNINFDPKEKTEAPPIED